MNQRLVISPEAESDIEKAFDWYKDKEDGLGRDFLVEARISIGKITERPLSFPIVRGKTRRVLLDRFPYSVFYIVIDDVVKVIGCIHQRRNPQVWKSR